MGTGTGNNCFLLSSPRPLSLRAMCLSHEMIHWQIQGGANLLAHPPWELPPSPTKKIRNPPLPDLDSILFFWFQVQKVLKLNFKWHVSHFVHYLWKTMGKVIMTLKCFYLWSWKLKAEASTIENNFRFIFKGCFTALFTKLPDGLPPYRMGSGGRSVWWFPVDIFPFCRERPVAEEPAVLRMGLLLFLMCSLHFMRNMLVATSLIARSHV